MIQRTKAGVVNGRLVRLTAEDGPVGVICLELDRIFDVLIDAPFSLSEREVIEMTARGKALLWALHEIIPEYTLQEINWQMEHRRTARLENRGR